MKIYEIILYDNGDPLYAKSKQHIKALMKEFHFDESDIEHIFEQEFEYNLDSICNLCSSVWR